MSEPGAVVVTGGSGALGRAVVAELLARGRRVAVPYRNAAGFDALRKRVGPEATLWGAPCDVSQLEATERFLAAARREVGTIGGLAALAGGYDGGSPLHESAPERWDEMLRANLQTAFATCRAALPHLLEAGGSVVTVSARSVATGGSGAAAYTVAKAGVEALTRALAAENAGRVRFNAIAPSIIDTTANRRAMPDADHSKWATPEEIAQVVAFLLSPASAPTTGAVIPVSGRSG